MDELTEKEYYILGELSRREDLSQRAMSDKVGLSLGMTNFLLKKMLKTGLIKINQLNKKKLKYLLTEKGFKEKAKKSYHYMLKTIIQYKAMETNIAKMLLGEYRKGKRIFCLEEKNDLSGIIEETVLKLNLPDVRVIYSGCQPAAGNLYDKKLAVSFFTNSGTIINRPNDSINLVNSL